MNLICEPIKMIDQSHVAKKALWKCSIDFPNPVRKNSRTCVHILFT